jgi:hypothetical protein
VPAAGPAPRRVALGVRPPAHAGSQARASARGKEPDRPGSQLQRPLHGAALGRGQPRKVEHDDQSLVQDRTDPARAEAPWKAGNLPDEHLDHRQRDAAAGVRLAEAGSLELDVEALELVVGLRYVVDVH